MWPEQPTKLQISGKSRTKNDHAGMNWSSVPHGMRTQIPFSCRFKMSLFRIWWICA